MGSYLYYLFQLPNELSLSIDKITECRKAEIERNLWRSPDLNYRLKQDHQEVLTSIMFRWCLNISKNGGSTTSLGNCYQFLATLKIKMSPDIQKETPVFQCVPLASCPLIRYHGEDSGSVFFKPSLSSGIYLH